MTLQARLSKNDDRLYNVNRDVAHNLPYVAKLLASRLEDGDSWPELFAYLQQHELGVHDLADGMGAMIEFLRTAVDHKEETMDQALARSGFLSLPDPVRVAICAQLGAIMLGIYFTGARDATLGGEGPAMKMVELMEGGDQTLRELLGRRSLWARLRRAVRGLWAKLAAEGSDNG